MNAPAKNFQTLLGEHLTAEITVHRILLGLAEAKQKHIVAADLTSFNSVLLQEQKPMEEAGFLRKQRDRLFQGLAERLNVPLANLKLGTLIQRLPDPARTELSAKHAELKAVVEKFGQMNDSNQVLIRHSLGIVSGVLKTIFVQTEEQAPGGYDRQGQDGMKGGRGRLVDMSG
jgi:hypothetical protein